MRFASLPIVCFAAAAPSMFAQQVWTWSDVVAKMDAANPALRAAQIGIDESKAQEITAYLKPNPEVTATLDQFNPFTPNPYRPLANTLPFGSASYLYERGGKRELRRESARKATGIAELNLADQRRNLQFDLRAAFVRVLRAKSVLKLADENLAYYDRFLEVNRARLSAGDIAQVDLDRLELQRVQYETDRAAADVDLRTGKIQLLAILNDRTPVDGFDVSGAYETTDKLPPLEDLRRSALDGRPDLRAAVAAIDKAKTDHQLAVANGTSDPTFSVDIGRNPPIPAYFGLSMSIPLRIHDKNQGEKLRTELDVTRNERLRDLAEAEIYSDVDSAWAAVSNNLMLAKSFHDRYLQQALRVRDTVSFAYQNGGASLLDFLGAQNDYRAVQLNFLNLIGAYLTAAGQLNLAVGREVIP